MNILRKEILVTFTSEWEYPNYRNFQEKKLGIVPLIEIGEVNLQPLQASAMNLVNYLRSRHGMGNTEETESFT